MIDIRHGDCIEVMRAMDDACVDAIVTDPPYEIGMMCRKWDCTGIAYNVEMWSEALRVLKPGGYIVAFSSSRTYGRMQVAIEDAGFITHPMIGWIFGQGFPKATKLQTPNTEHLRYGLQALKPALEPIYMGQKPMAGTGTQNWLEYGTGAINIDACRVEWTNGKVPEIGTPGWGGPAKKLTVAPGQVGRTVERTSPNAEGRWPANVIHDGSDEVLAAFAQFGERKNGGQNATSPQDINNAIYGGGRKIGAPTNFAGDSGTAARFFYAAKASRADRAGSKHPTVKPLSLMKYLVRLVTPPSGTVLDPFAGSGTTLQAAMEEGCSAIGIEREAEYVNDIRNRVSAAREGLGLFAVAAE